MARRRQFEPLDMPHSMGSLPAPFDFTLRNICLHSHCEHHFQRKNVFEQFFTNNDFLKINYRPGAGMGLAPNRAPGDMPNNDDAIIIPGNSFEL